MRVKRFEYLLSKYSSNIWTEDDYFSFWKFKYRPNYNNDMIINYNNYYSNYYSDYYKRYNLR